MKNEDLIKHMTMYFSSTLSLNKSVQVSYDCENSMMWLNGEGHWKEYWPEDVSKVYQTHDKAFVQVNNSFQILKLFFEQ